MSNLITAILNLIESSKTELNSVVHSHIRANNRGEALEEYVKDLFANTVDIVDGMERNEKLNEVFSYLGNQNNPPDAMLKQGDAIEIKKIESSHSSIALNSSYPKSKLLCNDSMISHSCKSCEAWDEKDMLYVVGVVNNDNLTSLAFVYGDLYCASKECYERIKKSIKDGVNRIPGVDFTTTKELGRVNKVDPLGITYLRIRGMWGIENPFTVFNYIYHKDETKKFNFMCLLTDQKFYSFANHNDLLLYSETNKNVLISNVRIKDPNNPAQLINSKLITFSI